MSNLVSHFKQIVKATPLSKLRPSRTDSARDLKDVFVGLASIPVRSASLKIVVESLLPQVKGLGVYLNNWDDVPAFLKNPKIQIARSQDHGDVRDNGKFFFIDKTDAAFYATVDDDIAYPKDYIAKLVSYQQMLGGTYAVGVHCSIYPPEIKKLLRQRHLWHFNDKASSLLPVDMIGTGTLLFERAYWNLEYKEIGAPGMADVWFAVAAKKRNFGLWVVPRNAKWLTTIEQEDPSDNLFNEGRLDDNVQVRALSGAKVGSTRGSLLEQVVRVPKVGSSFSIADADEMVRATNKISLEALTEEQFRFYDFAFVVHKREGNKNLDERLDAILERYVAFLLRRMSGHIYANDIDFEEEYKELLKEIGKENLPDFAERDWAYLGL
ncbi:MAG: hypothetical protein ACKOOD_02805 [Microbacteriaceae bacterium]